jgi:hypothetical protein
MSATISYQFLSNKKINPGDAVISQRRLDAILKDSSFVTGYYVGGTFPAYVAKQYWGSSSNINNQVVFSFNKGQKITIAIDQELNFMYQLTLDNSELISLKHILEEITLCYYYMNKILSSLGENLQYKVIINAENFYEIWADFQSLNEKPGLSVLSNWRFVKEQVIKTMTQNELKMPVTLDTAVPSEITVLERNKDLLIELFLDFSYFIEGTRRGSDGCMIIDRLQIDKNKNLKSIVDEVLRNPMKQ